MKTKVMTMHALDAAQLALERYDMPPASQDPKKLLGNTKVDLVAVVAEDSPKPFTNGRFIDVSLGELLSLGVIGRYYEHFNKVSQEVVVGLEDASKPQLEAILSDGAIREHGKAARMIFQQVSAQDYHLGPGKTIEDEIIDKIKKKEAKREVYPEKCALIVNVYSEGGDIDFWRVMNECNLEAFGLYYCIIYPLPPLAQCMVTLLDKKISPDNFQRAQLPIKLTRK